MNVFYFFDADKGVNISKVREIKAACEDKVRITFDNGDTKTFSTESDANYAVELFNKTIVQLIPCTAPYFNVYSDDETYSVERFDYFALCADGEIRSLTGADMFFELSDNECNFVGFFSEDMLAQYLKSGVGSLKQKQN